jgi:transposase-like protein
MSELIQHQDDDRPGIGRPSKYDPEFHPRIAKKMCELGAIDREIAEAFDIAMSTFYLWRNTYPEFSETLKVGKAPADERVKRSLFARACGYSHEEVDVKVVQNQITLTPTIKHYPPDTMAAMYWLNNRCKDEFSVHPKESQGGDLAEAIREAINKAPN